MINMELKEEIQNKQSELTMLKERLKESREAEKQAKVKFMADRSVRLEEELIVLNRVLKAIYQYKKSTANQQNNLRIKDTILNILDGEDYK